MPVSALNFHLDSAECEARATGAAVLRDAAVREDGSVPPGLRVLENFVTEAEEAELLRRLDAEGAWRASTFSGSNHSQMWGARPDWGGRTVRKPDPAKGEREMPEWLDFIVERFQRAHPSLSAWWANQCNANEYVRSRGDFLRPHFDDRRLAGEIIVNVCLASDCVMTFARPNSSVEYRVPLPRRAASVMSRAARWDFTHEIKREDFLGERRVSLNFRQAPAP